MSRGRFEREDQAAVDAAAAGELAEAARMLPMSDADRLALQQLRLVEWIEQREAAREARGRDDGAGIAATSGYTSTQTTLPATPSPDAAEGSIARECRRGHVLPPGVTRCAVCWG